MLELQVSDHIQLILPVLSPQVKTNTMPKHDLECAIRYLNFVNRAREADDGEDTPAGAKAILRKLAEPDFLPTQREFRAAFKIAQHQPDVGHSMRLSERVAFLQAMESSGAKPPPSMVIPPLLPEDKIFQR